MLTKAQFHRFSIAIQDFKKAKEFLEEAKKHQLGSVVHEALVFTAIVCYFRPFTKNERDKKSRVASRIKLADFAQLTEQQRIIHKKCKELRNKALAHAESKFYPTSIDEETGVMRSRIFSLVGMTPDLNSLDNLISDFIRQCHNRRADYSNSIRTSKLKAEESIV